MANAQPPEQDTFPKSGKVNEMCKEWLVREDGALAYRLQHQEISDHLQGNRHRNALVREDFPRALDEQIREQQLAEQAAAVYHQMLAEQEEIDTMYAKQLAERIEREERAKRRGVEVYDERIANQLSAIPSDYPSHHSPQKLTGSSPRTPESYPSPFRPDNGNYHANSPRRQALAMPLPSANKNILGPQISNVQQSDVPSCDHYLYTEPYKRPDDLANQFDRIDIAEVGLPLEELTEREIQEQKDALLARQLQEQEDSSEQSQMNRDRLLAIEAQDKELAKLLQERERQKVKRAKERAKQKALAKRQQQAQQEQDLHQIMPDDSYSNPVDLLPTPQNTISKTNNSPKFIQNHPEMIGSDEDINYSFPVDMVSSRSQDYTLKQNYLPQNGMGSYANNHNDIINDVRQPIRPTQLDLRAPLNHQTKPRYPDPEFIDNQLQSPSNSSHTNIAMAIDPTYNRKSQHLVPYCDTSSSTVTTSTSSSSPGIVLPQPDISEHEDENSPVPPYMPIQGQRRTASLEKKPKKKSKDGCKQQ